MAARLPHSVRLRAMPFGGLIGSGNGSTFRPAHATSSHGISSSAHARAEGVHLDPETAVARVASSDPPRSVPGTAGTRRWMIRANAREQREHVLGRAVTLEGQAVVRNGNQDAPVRQRVARHHSDDLAFRQCQQHHTLVLSRRSIRHSPSSRGRGLMAGSSCLAGAARSFKETPQRRLAMKASRSSESYVDPVLGEGRLMDSVLASPSGK